MRAARRIPVVTSRAGRRKYREIETTQRIATRLSGKSFLVLAMICLVGFALLLAQSYGAAKLGASTSFPSPHAERDATLSTTTLGHLGETKTTQGAETQVMDSSASFPNVINGVFLETSPRVSLTTPKDLVQSRSEMPQTLLSLSRALDPDRIEPNVKTSQLPTYLPICKWSQHLGQYLGEFVATETVEKGLVEAKLDCVTHGTHQCAGVTCSSSMLKCSARRGIPYLGPSPENEVSFTMECEQSEAAEDDLPMLPTNFTIPELDTSVFRVKPPGDRQPLGVGRSALVIIAHNRPEYLSRCLRTVVTQQGVDVFTLVVSLDDEPSFRKMEDALKEFQATRKVEVWKKPPEYAKRVEQKIAAHVRFALSQSFDKKKFEFAIFLESDLILAPDALWYFRSTGWLLREDLSLFCVSAWNDNGIRGLVSDQKRLFRTDYFPGLGWMIHNSTWQKIKDIWPKNPSTGWDHWLRHGSGLRPRECIVPEVPRTQHVDTKGTNVKAGNSISKRINSMVLSNLTPPDLQITSDLFINNYEDKLKKMLSHAKISAPRFDDLESLTPDKTYIIPYVREEYYSLAQKLGIYTDQPRTTHRGVVITRHPKNHAMLMLVDRRRGADYIPEVDLLKPHPKRRIAAAPKSQSCDQFCRNHRLHCDPRELEFINHCSVLKRYFPCDNGCGHQVGQEIPCYVHDTALDTALQCLVTDDKLPTCSAAHKSTTRLCACVP